jgi:uncharacterized Tic20 family protein
MSTDPKFATPPKPDGLPSPDDRTWAMLAHLSSLVAAAVGGMSFLGPLIIWLIKKDQSPFVGDQAKEALNFQIACTIATLICFAAAFVIIGFFLLPVVVVGNLVFTIIAAMEANKGVTYRYPYTIRLIN